MFLLIYNMYSNLHQPQTMIVMDFNVVKAPSDLAFRSNSSSESSYETSRLSGHTCWPLEVDAGSYISEQNLLSRVVAFFFHRMRPKHYFAHPWGSAQNKIFKSFIGNRLIKSQICKTTHRQNIFKKIHIKWCHKLMSSSCTFVCHQVSIKNELLAT